MRILVQLTLSLFAGLLAAPSLSAQGVPGLVATLRPEMTTVPVTRDVRFVLTLECKQDAELPGALMTGLDLEAKVGEGSPVTVKDAGKGGTIPVSAGTKIERKLTVAASKLMEGQAPAEGLTPVAVSWAGLAGASCVVKIAPDVSQRNVDDLDLSKTKVVLVTSMGEMTLAFRPDKAPETVKNYVKLAMSGFYDGTKFHRVIRNFMIQGGDPNTRNDNQAEWGKGGPGYTIKGEVNDLKHERGVMSMAHSGSPDSAGSQFFICHKEAKHLDGGYTAFGALEAGADVLDAIATTPVGGPQGSTPVTPVELFHAIVVPANKQ